MSNYDNWRELCVDLQLENQELRSELQEARDKLNEVKREMFDYRMKWLFAKKKLEGGVAE